MAVYAHRAKWFGWVGGGINPLSASAPIAGVIVNLVFARPLRAAPASAQFTATVAGTGRAVATTVVGGTGNKTLIITLAAGNLTAGQAVVITYVPGGTPANRLAYTSGEEIAGGVTTVIAA